MSSSSQVLFFRLFPHTRLLGRFSRDSQKAYFSSSWTRLKSCRPGGPVKFSVDKDNPLIDDNLTMTAYGLDPYQEITVMATTTYGQKQKMSFGSYGHFKASVDGFVDLSRDPSLNGTYIGVEPMGLFWSMVQNPNQRKGARLIKYDATTPLVYNLAVFSQHVSGECLWRSGSNLEPIAHTEIQRWYKKPNVKKISVDEAGIYGSLFIPEDRESDVPLPAVIDMYGSNGGLIESRAALLANRGFIVFSLPYILHKDLPNNFADVNFEYFQKAIDWFVNHPSVLAKDGIGVLGNSLGGVLTLYLAAHCPEVKAAISINGPPVFFFGGIEHNGNRVPAMGSECSTYEVDDEGIVTNQWELDDTKTFTIPSTSLTKVLIMVGDDDKVIRPASYKRWLPRNPMSKQSDIELVVYPGAGHLIEPPYTPLFQPAYVTIYEGIMNFGGTPALHAQAQEIIWSKIQEFFKKHL